MAREASSLLNITPAQIHRKDVGREDTSRSISTARTDMGDEECQRCHGHHCNRCTFQSESAVSQRDVVFDSFVSQKQRPADSPLTRTDSLTHAVSQRLATSRRLLSHRLPLTLYSDLTRAGGSYYVGEFLFEPCTANDAENERRRSRLFSGLAFF